MKESFAFKESSLKAQLGQAAAAAKSRAQDLMAEIDLLKAERAKAAADRADLEAQVAAITEINQQTNVSHSIPCCIYWKLILIVKSKIRMTFDEFLGFFGSFKEGRAKKNAVKSHSYFGLHNNNILSYYCN